MSKLDLKKDYTTFYFVLLMVLVVTVWIASIFILEYINSDLSDKSTLGDTFTGISSLFSGLAFAGIIYTIIVQRKEMRRQNEEFKRTTKLTALSALLDAYTESCHYWYSQVEGYKVEKNDSEIKRCQAAFYDASKNKWDCIDGIKDILNDADSKD